MNFRHLKVTLLLIVTLLANWVLQGSSGATAQASGLEQAAAPQTVDAAAAVVIPATFNYQGYVRKPDGTLETGTHIITARLYDKPIDGALLYEDTYQNVPVRDGLFNIVLGDAKPFSPDLFQNNAQLYLGITLDGGQELIPRQRLHAVPWALTASTLTPNASVNVSSLTATGPVTLTADATVNATHRIGDPGATGMFHDSSYTTSLRRYTVEAKGNGSKFGSTYVDDDTLQQLCADEDGCTLYLGMRDWSTIYEGTGLLAMLGPIRFSLGTKDGNNHRFWRSEGIDTGGSRFFAEHVDGDGNGDIVVAAWGCALADLGFTGGQPQEDKAPGFFLFNLHDPSYSSNPLMPCVLTIDD